MAQVHYLYNIDERSVWHCAGAYPDWQSCPHGLYDPAQYGFTSLASAYQAEKLSRDVDFARDRQPLIEVITRHVLFLRLGVVDRFPVAALRAACAQGYVAPLLAWPSARDRAVQPVVF